MAKYRTKKVQTSTSRVTLTPPTIHDLHRLSSERQFGQRGMFLPDEYHERMYQQKLLGGYSRKDPTCPECFVKVSKNGTCNC